MPEPILRLRTDEAAARLGVSQRTIRRYIHAGLLPAIRTPSRSKFGGGYRICVADIEVLERRLATPFRAQGSAGS